MKRARRAWWGVSLASVAIAAGCDRVAAPRPGPAASGPTAVVAYVTLDRERSGPIFGRFQDRSGVEVRATFDVEGAKAVGLTDRILAEADAPRCDLVWNDEILDTLRLKKRGLLARWSPTNAGDFPDSYRDKDGTWHGLAARARVLIVNTRALPSPADRPTSIHDLADPTWRGKTGIARPLSGTAATHAACLFAAIGDEKARAFFASLKANDVKVLSGNKQVAVDVAEGRLAFGLTDTDVAIAELEAGRPVAIVYPDQGEGQVGTLFIPNTVAILKGAPNPKGAASLAAFLLRPEVEEALARGPSAQIPLNVRVATPLRVETPKTVRPMAIDFEAADDQWEKVAAYLSAEFLGPSP